MRELHRPFVLTGVSRRFWELSRDSLTGKMGLVRPSLRVTPDSYLGKKVSDVPLVSGVSSFPRTQRRTRGSHFLCGWSTVARSSFWFLLPTHPVKGSSSPRSHSVIGDVRDYAAVPCRSSVDTGRRPTVGPLSDGPDLHTLGPSSPRRSERGSLVPK